MGRKPVFLIFMGLMFVLPLLLAAKYDFLLETGENTAKSAECNECHKLIYEEWKQDFHAKAYSNEAFRAGSKNYAEEKCVACHAAQDLKDEQDLMIRPVHKDEGINCTTCHLKEGMIYGPYKLRAKHKSAQNKGYLKAEICAGCHIPTYQEWQASGSRKNCQECHMPRVGRDLVQKPFLSLLLPKRWVGQHRMIFEDLLKGAARLTGEAGNGKIKVSVTNKGSDHQMPTGKYGDYQIILHTAVKDASGKEIFSKEEVLSSLKRNGVPPQKTIPFDYPVSFEMKKGFKVGATLVYRTPGREETLMAEWHQEF